MLWGGRVEANSICVLKGMNGLPYQTAAATCPAFPVWGHQAVLSGHSRNDTVGMINCCNVGVMDAVLILTSQTVSPTWEKNLLTGWSEIRSVFHSPYVVYKLLLEI